MEGQIGDGAFEGGKRGEFDGMKADAFVPFTAACAHIKPVSSASTVSTSAVSASGRRARILGSPRYVWGSLSSTRSCDGVLGEELGDSEQRTGNGGWTGKRAMKSYEESTTEGRSKEERRGEHACVWCFGEGLWLTGFVYSIVKTLAGSGTRGRMELGAEEKRGIEKRLAVRQMSGGTSTGVVRIVLAGYD